MGKRLQFNSGKSSVLGELGLRNRNVLVVQPTVPDVKGVMLDWTSDLSPMIVNVSQGKGWLKVLFSTGTTLTFMVNRPGDCSMYSLVIDGVK